MSTPLLHLEKVTMQFGGLKAVCDFELAMQPVFTAACDPCECSPCELAA